MFLKPQMSKSLRSSRMSCGLLLVPDMRMATTAWLSSCNWTMWLASSGMKDSTA